ncbi:MAG: TraR/DksA C4-type zinc finger protein [Campylobacterales bacterium]|nr:TraR/DksA C4-type zinc finger protein [Campylobacterales bacterium]
MTQEQKNILKSHIARLEEEVKEEIERLEEKVLPVSPDVSLGRLTRLEAIGEKSINESILREAKARQKRLIFAEHAIEREGYGLCRMCEEPIAFERLALMPESTLCVACANGAS